MNAAITNAGNFVSSRSPPHRLTDTGTQLLMANTVKPTINVTHNNVFKNCIAGSLQYRSY